jgi:hypothetical protein
VQKPTVQELEAASHDGHAAITEGDGHAGGERSEIGTGPP